MKSKYEKVLNRDVKYIKRTLLKELKKQNITSIAITGSFGRGEGSFIKQKGELIPYGDYDFLIVSKKRINPQKIKDIEEKIYNEDYYEHLIENEIKLDISNTTTKALKKLTPDLSSYDLKDSHKIIYGELIKKYFKIKKEDIPIISPFRIIFNRINVLFLALEKKHLNNKFSDYDKMNFNKLIDKLYIDILTGLTVKINKYSAFYKKRLNNFLSNKKRFKKLKKFIPDLEKKLDDSVKRKLNPNNKKEKIDIKIILNAIRDGIVISQFLLDQPLTNNFLDYASFLDKELPSIYYQEYLKHNIKTITGLKIKNEKILKFLSRISGSYENLYVKSKLKKAGLKDLKIKKSPIIQCIINSIYFYEYLKTKNTKDKSNLMNKIININSDFFNNKKRDLITQKEQLNKIWLAYTRRKNKRNLTNIPKEIFNIFKNLIIR